MTPVDGAYASLPAWTSARAWLALVERVLSSAKATKLRGKKVSVGTVLLVARADMAAADVRTGRGVSTSHETVARRLGMCKRTVGEARRLLEKLGLAVTVVMGRHLSPAERSQARRIHGGYQEAAASVRALTMPRPTEPVDTFHLPRSGSVLKESHLEKWLPTRADARETTATRPKLRKKSPRRGAPPRSPRPIEVQRFTWAIARNYGLDSGAPATSTGALYGGRHIGQLSNILERYEITPARYTLATLRAEIDEAMAASRIVPLENGQKRDRLAHFAWMLSKLKAFTRGETRLQRQLREHTERTQKRRDDATLARQAAEADERAQEDAETARAAFLAQFHHHRAHQRPSSATERAQAAKTLVHTLIGTTRHLYETPTGTQLIVGRISLLEKTLLEHAWLPQHDVDGHRARWTHTEQPIEISITIIDESDDSPRATIEHPSPLELPAAVRDQLASINLNE